MVKSRLSVTKRKSAGWVCVGLLLILGPGLTQAAMIGFEPSPSAGGPGSSLSVDIVGNFEDGIFSGNVNVAFDPLLLSVADWTVNAIWGVANKGSLDNGMISGIEFAKDEFSDCLPFCSGFDPGSYVLASLAFDLIGQVGDASPLTLSTSAGSIFEFTDQAVNTMNVQDLSFGTGSVSIVPEPPVLWLLSGGLVLLAALGRRFPPPTREGAKGLAGEVGTNGISRG
jgi:hypothetical protein